MSAWHDMEADEESEEIGEVRDNADALARTPPELAEALDVLESVVGIVSTGDRIPEEMHGRLVQLLTSTQAKVDLMQTAQVPLLAARLVRVSRLADRVERELERRVGVISNKELVGLLRALNAERAAVSRQIQGLAQRPAASSSDAMANTLSDPARPVEEQAAPLDIGGRRNVQDWMEQFQHKLREVAEEEQAAAARRTVQRRSAVDGVVDN